MKLEKNLHKAAAMLILCLTLTLTTPVAGFADGGPQDGGSTRPKPTRPTTRPTVARTTSPADAEPNTVANEPSVEDDSFSIEDLVNWFFGLVA